MYAFISYNKYLCDIFAYIYLFMSTGSLLSPGLNESNIVPPGQQVPRSWLYTGSINSGFSSGYMSMLKWQVS